MHFTINLAVSPGLDFILIDKLSVKSSASIFVAMWCWPASHCTPHILEYLAFTIFIGPHSFSQIENRPLSWRPFGILNLPRQNHNSSVDKCFFR